MVAKKSYLETGKQYNSLSLKDLLEASDAYHVYLTRKQNVTGTAISKYRRRKDGVPKTEPKTLANTEIYEYSWPCVMVFVKNWISEGEFGQNFTDLSEEYVPKTLFLPDGREIPVCVILADWQGKSLDNALKIKYSGVAATPGYPILTEIQNNSRQGTLGCLVTDGKLIYGLTNAHATGNPGENVYTITGGNERIIGVTSEKQLRKVPFTKIYENFAGRHVLVNMDIGLIALDDVGKASSQIYSMGNITGIEDVNHDTLSLKLIGCPVKGWGSVSGLMQGEITGLFYRYTSSGGFDYVADYLVTDRNTKTTDDDLPFTPSHGDSGTLFVIDDPETEENMKAIGVLWGGQEETIKGVKQPNGLVTNLGTICQQLDVELVGDWNADYDVYFGAYAHVVLPSLCAGVINNHPLKTLMENNARFIGMPIENTAVKQTQGLSKKNFVLLSDIADLMWKQRGGAYNRSYEGPNHFADMDQVNSQGKTLLEICRDPKKIEPGVWLEFYKDIKAREKGALPFRIAQIFDNMVEFAKNKKRTEFVGAAGILSHYVFDACMPLHISYLHHGDPQGNMQPKKQGKKQTDVPVAYDVHEEFDNDMVEYNYEEIKNYLLDFVKHTTRPDMPDYAVNIKTAKHAARAAVKLMSNTIEKSSPRKIIDDYETLVGRKKRDRCSALWQTYGQGLMESMAEGVLFTARLWEAAWREGNGDNNIQDTGAVKKEELMTLCKTRTGFLDSVKLAEITGKMHWK